MDEGSDEATYRGPERRQGVLDVQKTLIDVIIELKVLSNKVQNMHKSKNEAHERMLAQIEELVHHIHGRDGSGGLTNKVSGNSERIRTLTKTAEADRFWTRIFFTLIIALEGWALVKLYLV